VSIPRSALKIISLEHFKTAQVKSLNFLGNIFVDILLKYMLHYFHAGHAYHYEHVVMDQLGFS